MAQQGLDAILMFHQESMYYLFGYDALNHGEFQAGILPSDGRDVTVVCCAIDKELIGGLPFVDDVVGLLDDSLDDAAQITVRTLEKMNLLDRGQRIGIELRSHALLPYYYEELRRELDGRCELRDASGLVAELRIRKSPAEIEYVRRAASAQDAGYEAAFPAIRVGNRETGVLAEVLSGMFAAGGDSPGIWPTVASGPRTLASTHSSASGRVIKEDEMVQLVLSGCSRRYQVVGVQSKWVGRPPAAVQEAYKILTEAHLIALDHIAPGLPVSEMARRANTVLELAGMWEPGQHLGFGTGIGYAPTWSDNLRIHERESRVFEPNFVFSLSYRHTLNLDSGPVAITISEPILVTEEGYEKLSRHALTLDLTA
ncbi:hypothetical protein LK10_11600 [Sinomonas humi]|uniref:Xaa-Pro aminopeptidase n=1 Tax=Sinomonas humi TaxID=1338436 RepID=A0A0B2ALR2_9MICC|nr:hypothetical protein LK10_11600 [Sinomonas humi]